jgi:hypothetical protein
VRAQQPSDSRPQLLEAIPGAIALTLLAALPAFMNLNSHQIFEEQKSLLLVAGAIVALVAGLFDWRRVSTVARDPLVLAFLAFVVILFIASIGHEFPRAFWGAYNRRHGLLMWSALAVLLIAMSDAARTETGRRRLILAIVIGSLWPSAYLLIQRLGSDPVSWVIPAEGFDAGGTFGNRVFLGGYLALAIPLTTMLAVKENTKLFGLVLLQMTALMAAGSRGAILAVAASGVAFVAVAGRRLSTRTISYAAAAVAVPLIALLAVPALRPALIQQRLNLTGGSARVRLVIWQDVASLLGASGARLIIGHGPESLARLVGPHYSAELTSIEGSDVLPDRAHNEILDTMVNAGLVGLVLQATVFLLALWRLRVIDDIWMRAALTSALIAHGVELQFGIATVASRVAALAIVAIAVGLHLRPGFGGQVTHDEGEDDAALTRGGRLIIPAFVAAVSPFISMLPARTFTLPSSGGVSEFIGYLDSLSAGTTWLYVAMGTVALFVAWSFSRQVKWDAASWTRAAVIAASALAIVPLCLRPTFADGFTAAGASFEDKGQWTEAVVAYREAVSRAPDVAYYRASLGRALINQAMAGPPTGRDTLLKEVDGHYRRAQAMEPFDPDHSRHLAGLLRIRASQADEQAREPFLEEADRVYAGITGQVPALPSLWIEWAYLELDRGRPDAARQKLDHAAAMGGNQADHEKMAELRRAMAK